ncbi:putative superoxide dismutase protein [Eutypa lata UCREL1]|uniref:superoxide dismutase n=1 Tax=Eutypa lata (strain UCR-EL1) TaxID=1287681 RepID=M7T4G1_EUTLA|nr:putative superoxide dismutase protein [Eutypa lata UCREL1]
MHVSKILAISALGASGVLAQDASTSATQVTGNPADKAFVATLPEEPFWATGTLDGNVKGSISAKAGPDGVGVTFDVKFSNIPKEGGPFTYHLHVDPVPEDGNCTKTLAHLDPFQRGEDPTCDSSAPETCQVGDLSGKYGKITSDPFEASYHDPYTSLSEGVGSYFGNRSFVFHFSNKTRISCANFVAVSGGDGGSANGTYPTGIVSPTGTGSPTASPTSTSTVPVTAAANVLNAVKNFAAAPLVALLFML